MCSKEQLVAYLYDELSAAERAAFEAHASECEGCRREVRQLAVTRQHLASWAPPEPALDFRVVRGGSSAPGRRLAFVPAWALAAAASLLVLAGAAAIANVEVRHGPDGLVIRTGWASGATGAGARADGPPTASSPAPAVPVAAASEQVGGEMLVALERRLAELEAAQSAAPASGSARVSDEQLAAVAATMRRLIAESEARQRTELAAQIGHVWKDFNAARASDFVRVQETLGRAQGQTNYQLRRQQNSIESLYRVSLQK